MTTKEINLTEKIKVLEKERDAYKRGFDLLNQYFDSISDEEQPKVHDKILKIFKDI
jgi:flagellar motility protein MotE (MotC chaperone)